MFVNSDSILFNKCIINVIIHENEVLKNMFGRFLNFILINSMQYALVLPKTF